jgi:hypothetical protein
MLPQLPDFSLSFEQQFELQKVRSQVQQVGREDLEDLLIEVMKQKMSHENLVRGLIRQF